MTSRQTVLTWSAAALALICSCSDDPSTPPPTKSEVTTEHCNYVPLVATAGAGGVVTPGALTAGAAESVLDIPVGTALGGYTGRAGFVGAAANVDNRKVAISGTFNPSIGVGLAPRVKAVALSTATETVVIIKVDMIFTYEGMLFDVEQKLGPTFAGKVILASSHSHSGWAQFSGHAALKLGSGEFRKLVYDRFVDTIVSTAQAALQKRKPAKIGIVQDTQFDPQNQITQDRRRENDVLPGGNRKDTFMTMIRVDAAEIAEGAAGSAIAVLPVFGMHATLNGQTNAHASSDASGAIERVLEEKLPAGAVVIHLQGAGGDVSPVGHGGIDCAQRPGKPTDPCLDWTSEEGLGRAALPIMLASWQSAKPQLQTTVALEMLSRSIELGPTQETFAIRNGQLRYQPFDLDRNPDGKVLDDAGALISPIDEFNAPVGAALCEKEEAMFPAALMPGTDGIVPYGSCLRLDVAGDILQSIFKIDFEVDATHPICETTRTTISALRIGEFTFGTLPGEATVLLADLIREKAANLKPVVIGYAQGHVGYLLRPEDWVLGGYEPSVSFWGPLEAEHIAEQLLQLMPLAQTPAREDGSTAGTSRVVADTAVDPMEIDNPAPAAGTVPATVGAEIWSRIGPVASAQPTSQLPRVAGIATFVWNGDDPQVKTPRVTLQRKQGADFVPVVSSKGRVIADGEIILSYTPQPLRRVAGQPQTHVWAAEWQAVPAIGAEQPPASVALGEYRFAVEGSGWTLTSNSFEVTTAPLAAVTTRAGATVKATVTVLASKGWRLLDAVAKSNTPVPLRSQMFVLTQSTSAGPLPVQNVISNDAGEVSFTVAAAAISAELRDSSGNFVQFAIP
jgi:neutral ceramidase